MSRIYNVPLVRTAVTVGLDLAEITNASTKVLVIHAIELSQSTDVKDAEEEMLQLSIKSGQTTSGSGGNTGVVPVPVAKGDPAFAGTVESFNTTKASAGTIVTHKVFDWNLRVPFQYIFTPETRIVLPPSERMTLELVSAPADSVTIGGQIVIEELG